MTDDRRSHKKSNSGGRSSAAQGGAGRTGPAKSGSGKSGSGKSGFGKSGSGKGKSGSERGASGKGGRGSQSSKGSHRSAAKKGAGGQGTGRGGSGHGGGRPRSDSGSKGRGKPDAGKGAAKTRRDLKGAAVDLPHWVVEDLARVTPRERVGAALTELGTASNAMVEGRYKVALRAARRAKDLAPRDATVRETLGLAAYRVGDWQTALTELRTYRRLAGEPTHLPVEMDVLRALGRPADVVKSWATLQEAGASPAVHKEGLVVYGSFLIDEGRLEEARRLVTPKRLQPNPYPADLRVWYVAARANALAGDVDAARKLRDAIVVADPAFPGMDDLEVTISRATG